MTQRVALVREHRAEHGLRVCLSAFCVPRSTFYDQERARFQPDPEQALVAAIRRLITEHPAYGWRRLQAELFEVEGIQVNHKRLKRLLRDHSLGLPRQVVRKKRSAPAGLLERHAGEIDLVRGKTFGPLEAFSTDFTELVYAGGRKAWLMAVVDLDSKLVLGWAVGRTRNRELAITSLDASIRSLNELGLKPTRRIIHHDKDSVYTSYAWLAEVLLRNGMRVSYSENGARHNPWIESLWGRAKNELGSRVIEAESLQQLTAILDEHFVYYNSKRRHSALNQESPVQYLKARGYRFVSAN